MQDVFPLPGDDAVHSACKFFELPQELRDMIYDLVWTEQPNIRLQHCGKVYSVNYDRTTLREAQPHVLPTNSSTNWLLTSKRILEEGIQQLHRGMIWNFDERYGNPRTTLDRIPSTLVIPNKARALRFRLGTWDYIRNYHQCYVRDFSPKFLQMELSPLNWSSVRVIHIDFALDDVVDTSRPFFTQRPPYRHDMSHLGRLEHFKQLRRLSMTLYEEVPLGQSFVRRQVGSREEQRQLETLTKELARMGKIIVPGGLESKTSLQDFWSQYPLVEKHGGYTRWDYAIEK